MLWILHATVRAVKICMHTARLIVSPFNSNVSTDLDGGIANTPILPERPLSSKRGIRHCTEGRHRIVFEGCTP